MGFPFSRTWGGSGREGFLTRGERWTAGVRSSVGVPRKVRSAAAATNRALERWKALDHDDPRRLVVLEAGGGDQTCTTPEIARAKGACVRLVSWSRLACEVRRWTI